jgi:general secretion pathway protein F
MAIFKYKGLDKTGKEIKGNVNVENLAVAKARVKGMGIMLTEINEETSQNLKKGSVNITFGSGVSTVDSSC